MDSMRRNPLVRNLARSTTRRQGVIAGLRAVATGVLAVATTAAAPPSSRNATLPVADARLQRDKFAADGHRPRYHFLPPANWMNDPNGLIEWDGRAPLLPVQPGRRLWGNIHWGHAVSDDLSTGPTCRSRCRRPRVARTSAAASPAARWTTTACPPFVYTGVRGERYEVQTQCLATSPDGLQTWQNIRQPGPERDPGRGRPDARFSRSLCLARRGSWYMVLASRIAGVGGASSSIVPPTSIPGSIFRRRADRRGRQDRRRLGVCRTCSRWTTSGC